VRRVSEWEESHVTKERLYCEGRRKRRGLGVKNIVIGHLKSIENQ
jgi:hypothetical protein